MYKYKRLKELREDNDLNQKQVADVIGTTFQYYSSYELGIRDLPLERAIKLAIFYNTRNILFGKKFRKTGNHIFYKINYYRKHFSGNIAVKLFNTKNKV